MARMAENKKIMMSLGIDDSMRPLDALQRKKRQEKKSGTMPEGGRRPDDASDDTVAETRGQRMGKKKAKKEEGGMEPLRRSTRLRTQGELMSLPDDWKEGSYGRDSSDDGQEMDRKRQRPAVRRALYVKRDINGDDEEL
eukprot:748784-Hanusia_phi.AAC.1